MFTLLGWSLIVSALDVASLCADRAAIERVYYQHRLGDKPPFEQVLPAATLQNLVQQELGKEAALKKTYGVEVTPAMLEAEVQRIDATTRAPEVLAEIKAALGNDSARFARTLARPLLVERLLRDKFANDDARHAPQRREIERVRTELTNAAAVSRKSGGNEANDLTRTLLALLKQSHSNAVTETTWQLGARAAETNAPDAELLEAQKRFGPNARILSSPHGAGQELYFEDIPIELQNVLRVQLRACGDVSAVIETPAGFLLYIAKEKTDARLSVAGLSLPKCSYEEWLQEQVKK